VHVECDTREHAIEAAEAGADALLLDNMDPEQVVACLRDLDLLEVARPFVEVSGGVTLERAAACAETGVDAISVGAITIAAGVLDIGLDVVPGSGADVGRSTPTAG
jgi:nicotinate-nucleotide pyrophosphorylase (carboxylating)